MIDIVTALSVEARPLTEALRLKRKDTGGRFRTYENEEETIRLTVTGPGGILSAAAVGMLLGEAWTSGERHFLISFGSCAQVSQSKMTSDHKKPGTGRLFLGNQLVNTDSQRVFYPDLLIREDIPEAEILTGSRILEGLEDVKALEPVLREYVGNKEDYPGRETVLYDMESAAVYEAGSCFLGPHEMGFLRVVTDAGDGKNVTAEDVDRCVRNALPELLSYIQRADLFLRSQKKGDKEAELDGACATLSADLKCSVTMRHQLMQILRYFAAAGISWKEAVQPMYDRGILPVRSRTEGKRVLEKLSNRGQVRT